MISTTWKLPNDNKLENRVRVAAAPAFSPGSPEFATVGVCVV
jgi:hypothetical protein